MKMKLTYAQVKEALEMGFISPLNSAKKRMNKKPLNILSLFDGMSCGRIALERSGHEIGNYYASEIDKYAIQVTQHNYPDTKQLGSVTDWESWDIDWSSIDIVSGGFPCQAWSMAGKQLGDKDERGMLFWTMLDVMKKVREHNPKSHFLIENVKMKKEFEEYITFHTEQALGDVHKILINSALVSAQNRNRYYWTSFPVEQPQDKGLLLADIIEEDPADPTIMSEKFCARNAAILRDDLDGKAKNLSAMEYVKNGRQGDYIRCGAIRGRYIETETGEKKTEQQLEIRSDFKTNSLTTVQKDNVVVRSYNRKDGLGQVLDKAYPLNASDWRGLNRNQNAVCTEYRPASMVGRRLNENGVREDNNPDIPYTQCLQVKKDNAKMGCLTTVGKDTLLSQLPPGRYPVDDLKPEVINLDNSDYSERSKKQIIKNSKMPNQKAVAVCTNSNMTGSGVNVIINDNIHYRKLTPLECERLQTVPEGYTAVVSNTQRYKMLGNGWTVDVISHIYQQAKIYS